MDQKRFVEDIDDDTIDLFALMRTVWLGKWVIALFFVIAAFIGIYIAYFASTPIYRATSVVILETNQQSPVLDLQSVVSGASGDSTGVKSEIEVLRARSLMELVVNRMDLTNDPEFNSSLLPETKSDRWKSATIGFIKGLAIRATGGEYPPAPDADLPADVVAQRKLDSAVDTLLDKTTAQNINGSLVFRITAESESATKAAELADTIVALYIINQVNVKFEAMEQATAWLSNRVSELKIELEDAEGAIADFNAGTDLVSLEIIKDSELELNELRQRSAEARETLSDFDEALAAYQSATSLADKVAASNDPQLRRLAETVGSDPRSSAAFDARFDALFLRAEQNVESANLQITALDRLEQDLEARIAVQSRDLIALQQLTREAEATRLLYEYFLTRLKETSAQQGIQQADSRILSDAVIPRVPSEPKKSRIVALSGILGIMLGVGAVLLRASRRNGFQTAGELEKHTGVTVIGQIPTIPARKRMKVLDYLISKPASAAAEAVRDLRTSVMLSNLDNPPKVIVSTSSIPGEGKTTNSLALAQNLSSMGQKVLMIEGDIRRRTLNQYFDAKPTHGIVSVLSGDKRAEEVIEHFADKGFDVIFGEKTSANAADVFSSNRFKEFIAAQRENYDTIIIDTPPVLIVPDSRIIAQVADATLFSVKWDSTSRPQVDESLRLIQNANQKVTGLILSQVDAAGMKKYGYGGSYGAYAGYGAQYYSN
ncbi:capsular exopolysaccharide synthesis family protein [Loktanella ponticola]|uniref:non-specific protein-tyrosine kinase n=1 Tax=Yoonia ponticola TaxID=1524255 RepID=A0A7W9BIK9_9RHOB|nr:polysaccharide biosynthesis tyrosine autokinase [Yoonia ponticola]MBB5721227.1 capsular exopolysaccharide synthesis family protein [Yoonia ponticola]